MFNFVQNAARLGQPLLFFVLFSYTRGDRRFMFWCGDVDAHIQRDHLASENSDRYSKDVAVRLFQKEDRMGVRASWLLLATALIAPAAVSAQTTTGTISGQVVDDQSLPIPGVTVTVTSPNLQGTRSVTTSQHGDYIVTLLPPGRYTVLFELSGFQQQSKTVGLAPTQALPLDITLGPATVSEAVSVIGSASANVLTQTANSATAARILALRRAGTHTTIHSAR